MNGDVARQKTREAVPGGRGARIAWGAALAAIIAAVGFQLTWFVRRAVRVPEPVLAMVLPSRVDGWVVTDLPLGPTEQLVSVAKRMLRHDDYVYRTYRRGDTEFAVYVGHWRRNSMPTKLVAQHTPDICWPAQGWRCVQRAKEPPYAGWAGAPIEYREFLQGENVRSRVYVLFWHLADGRLQESEDGETYWQWWRGAFGRAAVGSPAQYFIRVSTNRPLEEMRRQPVFSQILKILTGLGQG